MIHTPRRQYYSSDYWTILGTAQYPDWMHDFISIHGGGEQYSLISPLCLVDPATGKRPRFERKLFATPQSARDYAMRLIRRVRVCVHIVDFCDGAA